jgi:hypothetical protein
MKLTNKDLIIDKLYFTLIKILFCTKDRFTTHSTHQSWKCLKIFTRTTRTKIILKVFLIFCWFLLGIVIWLVYFTKIEFYKLFNLHSFSNFYLTHCFQDNLRCMTNRKFIRNFERNNIHFLDKIFLSPWLPRCIPRKQLKKYDPNAEYITFWWIGILDKGLRWHIEWCTNIILSFYFRLWPNSKTKISNFPPSSRFEDISWF